MKINICSKEKYDNLMNTESGDVIYNALKYLPVETEMEAIELSLLKWKIITENTNLSARDRKTIGGNMQTCGLCRFFDENKEDLTTARIYPDCQLCFELTGFYEGFVCFSEYYEWVKLGRDVLWNGTQLQEKSTIMHGVLRELYEKKLKEGFK